MRILFLDDDPRRQREFREKHKAQGIVIDAALSADAAISLMKERDRYDIVSLDHDLCHGHHACMRKQAPIEDYIKHGKTGVSVVREMTRLSIDKLPLCVVIHSMNMAGALAMHEEIDGTKPLCKLAMAAFGTSEYDEILDKWIEANKR